MDDIFLGELPQSSTGTAPAGYDSSGVNPNPVTEVITPDEQNEEAPAESSNNWIMYLGVGIMAYVLLFKKK
jgi:hypothetical protein